MKVTNLILIGLICGATSNLASGQSEITIGCARDLNKDGYVDYNSETVWGLTPSLCQNLEGAVIDPKALPEELLGSSSLEFSFTRVTNNISQMFLTPAYAATAQREPAGGRAPPAMRDWVNKCRPKHPYVPRGGDSHYVCVQYAVDMLQCLNAMQIEGYEITNTIFMIHRKGGEASGHQIVDIHYGGLTYWFEPQNGLQVNMDQNGDGYVGNKDGSTEGNFDHIQWSTDPASFPHGIR